ncbi:14 kDa proline-rich protein DC2.15-like [Cryptomeria japonica]|uniref:14 kDa proline-rich protein DC2.15-like n=1 Tax=Cryptomeria japonica TaxID=3369 RepID=UPI0027DA21DD|nr:14 kDa proline-rich protein DC2.15-like [Cryptomeria japonica]
MGSKNACVCVLLLLLLITTLVLSTHAKNDIQDCPPPPARPTGSGPLVCPKDTLQLGACVDILKLVHVVVGDPKQHRCCSVLGDFIELDAAVCLCTAVKANILGLDISIPVALNLLITCGKQVPSSFVCA